MPSPHTTCLLAFFALGATACPQTRTAPPGDPDQSQTPPGPALVMATGEDAGVAAQCAAPRAIELPPEPDTSCARPIPLECSPAVYRGTTCGAGNHTDVCRTAREAGREDVLLSIALPTDRCCSIRLPWWTGLRAGYGHGAACSESGKSCAYGKGPRGLTGTVTPSRAGAVDTFWLMLEAGAEGCGPFEFAVAPCDCPAPQMSFED